VQPSFAWKRGLVPKINKNLLAAFYTSYIFFGIKIDIDKLKYAENLNIRKIHNLIYFFIIYLSGIICLAYIAGYIVSY
jgi:hypothetical protein